MAEVPVEIRSKVAGELDRLVRGELPELLVSVNEYPAVLMPQPDAIWDHRCTDATRTADGGWHVVVPLFTESESPSDLSAEIIIDSVGNAMLHDVHVL